MGKNDKQVHQIIRDAYQAIVQHAHPAEASRWPILSGFDMRSGTFHDWTIFFLKHTGNPTIHSHSPAGELSHNVSFGKITDGNLDEVRDFFYGHFRASMDDGLIIVPPGGALLPRELLAMLRRHEMALGLSKIKVFLSHKSPDKAMVRDFKTTLDLMGYDTWLDEDAMAAGSQLDRSILKGMQDSCAAVFFLTPNFADEKFLASEINYAIQQQRERPQHFSIITLLFPEDDVRPPVPELLRPFVWKEPGTQLEAVREIIRALPLKLGRANWR